MNIHKSKKIKTGAKLKVYPLGVIEEPSGFCDILSKEWGHVCCVISIPCIDEKEEIQFVKDKGEFVHWDSDGFPDVYLKNKRITFAAMKKGLRLLEKDLNNRFSYKLIKKNFFEICTKTKR